MRLWVKNRIVSIMQDAGSAQTFIKGYLVGGTNGTATKLANALVYASKTISQLVSSLSVAMSGMSGCSSNTNGYFGGGMNNSLAFSYAINKINSSVNVFSIIVGVLPTFHNMSGIVQSTLKGYFVSGLVTITTYTSIITEFLFSTETTSNSVAGLTVARAYIASVNSLLAGYLFNGSTGTGAKSSIDKILFSTDTICSKLGIQLANTNYGMIGLCNYINGYIAGGSSSNTTYQKIALSTETVSSMSLRLSGVGHRETQGISSNLDGYSCGGMYSSSTYLNTIDDLTFSTETNTLLGIVLSVTVTDIAGCSVS